MSKKNTSYKKKRRIKYIEKTFQRNFIIKYCAICIVAMTLASLVLYLLAQDTVTASYTYHHLNIENTADAIINQIVAANIAVFFAFVILTVGVTLHVSFRIGGPLYRFSQDLNLIGNGNISKRIRLRKGDQLVNFADNINEMADNLESRIRRVQTSAKELKDLSQKNTVENSEILSKIDELDELCHRLFDQPA